MTWMILGTHHFRFFRKPPNFLLDQVFPATVWPSTFPFSPSSSGTPQQKSNVHTAADMTQRTYHARLQKHRRHRKVCKNTNQRLQFTNIHLCTIIIHNTYPIIFPFRIFGAAPPGVALSKWTRLLSDAAKRCRWQTVGSILDGLHARLVDSESGQFCLYFLW